MKPRACKTCQTLWTPKAQRGRPPHDCDNCRAPSASKASKAPADPPQEGPVEPGTNVGASVKIVAHELRGVPIYEVTGTLTGWDADGRGPYAVVSTSEGNRFARSEHLAFI